MPAKRDRGLFGRLAVARRLISQEQLDECLAIQRASPGRRLGELLVERGYMTEESVFKVIRLQQMRMGSSVTRGPGKETLAMGVAPDARFGDFLVKRELSDERFAATFEVIRQHEPYVLTMLSPAESVRTGDAFRAAARALQSISHPALARQLLEGVDDGMAWSIREWLAGGTLSGVLSRRPLDAAPAAELLAHLGRGLEAAHGAGVIHGSLSPDAVHYRSSGAAALFGFAAAPLKLLGADELRGRVLAFRAPEQLNARGVADHRADIYGLGALGLHLLCGRALVTGEVEAQADQIRGQGLPSARALAPMTPKPLAAILEQATDPDPDQRYSAAPELVADLERFLGGQPVQARGRGSRRIFGWVRRLWGG